MLPAEWISQYPVLENLGESVRSRVLNEAAPVEAPKGSLLFQPGTVCPGYGILLKGTVRVQIVSQTGREIVLYRVRPGDTCVQTAVCLMGGADYSAEGIAESDVVAAMVSPELFEDMLGESPSFRKFVFSSFGARLGDMMRLIEGVRFESFDRRLARFLLDHMNDDGKVSMTHQRIATELGSAREVVSRQLKSLEESEIVGLGRGVIRVEDVSALELIASASQAA